MFGKIIFISESVAHLENTLKNDADGLDSDGANWYSINELNKKELSPFTILALEKLGYSIK